MADPRMDMERTFAAKVFDALKTWLAKVRTAVMGPWNKFKSKPNPVEVHVAQPIWLRLITALEHDLLSSAQLGIDEGGAGNRVTAAQDAFIQSELGKVHTFLARIPDEVQAMITREIANATNDGATLEQIAARVDAILDASGSDRWRNRANTIAATETHRMANAGVQAAGSAVQRLEGSQLTKQWVTRHDNDVRTAHKETDGQTVPMNSFFKVGTDPGFPMLYPGDPNAPAELTVNCRCSMKIADKVDK